MQLLHVKDHGTKAAKRANRITEQFLLFQRVRVENDKNGVEEEEEEENVLVLLHLIVPKKAEFPAHI